jgi:hypothetical protein
MAVVDKISDYYIVVFNSMAEKYMRIPFLRLDNIFPTYFLYFELSTVSYSFIYISFISCLILMWWAMFVVLLIVAVDLVADNYVHIPFLRPIKFFPTDFIDFELLSLLI